MYLVQLLGKGNFNISIISYVNQLIHWLINFQLLLHKIKSELFAL